MVVWFRVCQEGSVSLRAGAASTGGLDWVRVYLGAHPVVTVRPQLLSDSQPETRLLTLWTVVCLNVLMMCQVAFPREMREGGRQRQRELKTEAAVFYNLISGVACSHFCGVLSVTSAAWEGTTRGCEYQEVESLGSYWRLVAMKRLLAEPHSESLDSTSGWPLGREGVEGPPCGPVGGTMERHLGGRKGCVWALQG